MQLPKIRLKRGLLRMGLVDVRLETVGTNLGLQNGTSASKADTSAGQNGTSEPKP